MRNLPNTSPVAFQPLLRSKTHGPIFSAPPTIVKFPENGIVLAEKGDEVSLSCVGEGKPEPVITWTRVVCMILSCIFHIKIKITH